MRKSKQSPIALISKILGENPTYSATDLERVLGLKRGTFEKWIDDGKAPPDGTALLKILSTFPWMVNVVRDRFTPIAVKEHLMHAGVEEIVKELKELNEEGIEK